MLTDDELDYVLDVLTDHLEQLQYTPADFYVVEAALYALNDFGFLTNDNTLKENNNE